jgi:ligand-binding sensor domain-containing protein
MKKRRQIHWLFIMLIFLASCKGQNHTDQSENNKNQIGSEFSSILNVVKSDTLFVNNAPNSITRSIIQDKAGNIWFATFEGIFKYDGNSFANISKEVSQSRFFSVLEDRKSNLWFGSIGSGVYYYNGKTFRNLTTNDGLINNEVVCIYEDKIGNIWFGTNGGISTYDGKYFRNYMLNGDTIIEDNTGKYIPNLRRPMNEVNSIIEDKTGKFWFGTRGSTFIYDGKTFNTITQNGKPFTNVRWIIEDNNGNIWLGGNDGLWCYDGIVFKNITKDFVGYIYEDKNGNIWTSSKSAGGWALSRYEITFFYFKKRTVTEIKTGEGMFFGILEDSDGNIWSGKLDGVYRYDGNTLDFFKRREFWK